MSAVHIPHPLDGFDAKLARADSHLQAVEDAIGEMTSPDPEILPSDLDTKPGEYVFRAQRDSWHPEWLAPIIGDCVHNFRAALDYLIWELVALAGNRGDSSTEFPIFVDPKLYAVHAPKKIRGIDPRAKTVIEGLQPFAGPNSQPGNPAWREPEREPLALLYGLDIWDKHRSLRLTEDALAILLRMPGSGVYTPPDPIVIPGHFKRGAIVAGLRNAKPDMNVYLEATNHIAFERGGPAEREDVVKTLNGIRQEVRGRVLPALAPFFPKR